MNRKVEDEEPEPEEDEDDDDLDEEKKEENDDKDENEILKDIDSDSSKHYISIGSNGESKERETGQETSEKIQITVLPVGRTACITRIIVFFIDCLKLARKNLHLMRKKMRIKKKISTGLAPLSNLRKKKQLKKKQKQMFQK